MSAQINLYHERFRRQRELLSLPYVAAAAAAVVVLVVGVAIWTKGVADEAVAQAAEKEVQATALRGQFDATMATLKRQPDPALVQKIADMEQTLKRREATVGLLKIAMPEGKQGFSGILRGFARQTPPGVWLTGLTLEAAGAMMEIHGRMTDAALLPTYIGRLGEDKVFAGRHFAALDVIRPTTAAAPGKSPVPAPYLEFVLRPTGVAAAEKKS